MQSSLDFNFFKLAKLRILEISYLETKILIFLSLLSPVPDPKTMAEKSAQSKMRTWLFKHNIFTCF